MLRIYGKTPESKKFKAMDMTSGIPVDNLIYASFYNDGKKESLIEWCKELESDNEGWKFEVRKA